MQQFCRFFLRNVVAIVAILAVTSMMFSGCEEKDDPIDAGTEQDANIVTFTFEGIEGKADIDKTAHTVTAKADETVDLTAVKAEFTLSPNAIAKVGNATQVSGQTVNNFSAPVTYTVTSGDGETTHDWTVTVTGGKHDETGDCQTELTSEMVREGGTLPKCTYIVKSSLSINNGKTLTFLPGTVVKFDKTQWGLTSLRGSSATIVAKGTEQEPIIFTSAQENKTLGDWGSVQFSDCDLEWCTFEYGGGILDGDDTYAMTNFLGDISIKHCIFREALGIGLNVAGTFAAFEYNTITNCGERDNKDDYPMCVGNNATRGSIKAIEAMGEGNVINTEKGVLMGSDVRQTTVLHKLNCPYIFPTMYGILVTNTATLTIEAGVHIKIGRGNADDTFAIENGTLMAQGTAEDPIIITGTVAGAGQWGGVFFSRNRGAGCILEYCRIIGGGYDAPGAGDACVRIDGSPGDAANGMPPVTVRNCYIADSPTWGIYFSAGALCNQSGNEFENCALGNYPNN